jgi:hypothetical protein
MGERATLIESSAAGRLNLPIRLLAQSRHGDSAFAGGLYWQQDNP